MQRGSDRDLEKCLAMVFSNNALNLTADGCAFTILPVVKASIEINEFGLGPLQGPVAGLGIDLYLL
jgi:hypothetical protein